MAKWISFTLFASFFVLTIQKPEKASKTTLTDTAGPFTDMTDPKHRAVHQYRSVCHEDGTCSYIFTLTVPAKLGNALNLPNMDELAGTSMRSEKEIRAFKEQLFSLHSQLMNLTQSSEADTKQVHHDVNDLKSTVVNIDDKVAKIDLESKMLNDGVSHLKKDVTTMERRLQEENKKTEAELSETMDQIDKARLRMSRIEKIVNGDIGEDELVLTVDSVSRKPLKHIIAIGTDCATLYENDMRTSGIYRIQPDPNNDTRRFEVYCDMETDGGGWTVIQRREDGSEDFYRGWDVYKEGFGELNGEFWLGLDKMHFLNEMGNKVIRFDMWDFTDDYAFAEYGKFKLMDEEAGYRIQVGKFNGTAGNAFHYSNYHLRHNNMKFSTFDHNENPYGRNCPRLYQSGWWFHNCMIANLNGLYYHGHNGYYESHFKDGIMWQPWKTSLSLKKTEIKIRPQHFGEGSTKIRMRG